MWYTSGMARYDEGIWHRYGLEGPGPEKYRTFLTIPLFVRRWEALGLGDDDLLPLESEIMEDPAAGDVVAGSGGVRKARFAPPSMRKGKRGSVRVYYTHLPEFNVVILISAYAKHEVATVSQGQLKQFGKVVGRIQRALAARRASSNGGLR